MEPQFVLSHWIFAWYVFYVLGFTKFNPKIGLILGLLYNICMALVIFYFKKEWSWFIYIVVFFYKGIPLWSLRHTPYQWKDFYGFVVLSMIFLVFLSVNGRLKIPDVKHELLKADIHRKLS